MDDEYDIRDRYIQSFVQHLKDTGARLGLRVGSQADEDRINREEAVPRTHALSTWTPAEYDAFFRAVSVHSRWRPDLIAACVPTRSQWEVWMHLEALEEGAARLAMEHGDEDVDMQDDRSSSHSGSGMDEDEDVCEPALEVSQAWIDMEERIASWIAEEECRGSLENGGVADTEGDEPPKRRRGRSRGTGKGRAQSRVRGQTVSNEGFSPSVRRSLSPESTSASVCKREALMACLEVPHLLVLDNMLREGEEAMNKRREESIPATPTEDELKTTPQITGETSRSPSDAVIHPVLLALPRGADSVTSKPDESTIRGASPLSARPTSTDPDTNANVGSDTSLFSPRSRRRHQKRLYMRRKRALEKGRGAVDTRIERLKPGKKAKSEQSPVSTPEAPSDGEVESTEDVSKNCRGLTLPYKLKAQFADLGIDVAYLRGQGMDLLNMSALGKLMGLYSSLELGEEADETAIAECIDAELIRHLQAAVVLFVTDVIHRAIVWKERDIRLKRRSQVWRHGEQITINAVEHAVETIGARYASHKEYFRTLEALHGFSTGPSACGKAAEQASVPVDPDVEYAKPWSISPHREAYGPLIYQPRLDPPGEETLLSDSTDSSVLGAELAEEEEEEGRDMALGRAHEEDLWGGG